MVVSWNWLQEYLGTTDLTAEAAADLLGAHAFEIEGVEAKGKDFVIDIDVLPNRSSDCLCHRGIARELASVLRTSLYHDPLAENQATTLPVTEKISIAIEDKTACPRFAASLVTGVKVQESPRWLQERLEAIGQRPINNIVDATNYVMFALGQPIHAYDAELFPQVDGKWQFIVRVARPGETIALIPEAGKEEDRVVTCEGTELLIVDGSSDTPIGLAGVKGGSFAGINTDTKQIIIETAHFDPIITRKTARRLGIVIDASKRFENEPARGLIPPTQREVTTLITKIAGGEVEGWVDQYLEPSEPKAVVVNVGKANQRLGLALSTEDVEDILTWIGATITKTEQGFEAIGPWERTDLTIEEDYIEELGRLHGYGHISAIAPEAQSLTEVNARHYYSEQIRHALLSAGFSEVVTSSFRKKDTVQLKNALASDKSCLRSNLTKNISEALDRNAGFADLLGTSDTRLFEIGTVFYKANDSVTEHVALGFGVRSKPSGYSGKEDGVIQETIQQLNELLGVEINCSVEKGIAECNLTRIVETLPPPTKYDPVTVGKSISYQPFSVYQHMSRDIALWVDAGTTPAAVKAVLDESAGSLCVRTTLFDEFTKEGRTSLAFRLVFQSSNRTLTDTEVNALMETVYQVVEKKGWEVR